MKDQKVHWNNAHQKQWLRVHSQHQTEFATEVEAKINKNSSILELGCGEGNDSIFFAQHGHSTEATDFSDIVIKQNQERYQHANLQFKEQDISKPLDFADETFDVVYARLSLHYFANKVTLKIFQEIKRVLKPGGELHFMCKSTHDSIYGKGEKIEDDMYELDGHVRHFFSEVYVNSLLKEVGLTVEHIHSGEEVIYDRHSAFVKVAARKV